MRLYIEMADGSLLSWEKSLSALEEKIYNLERRGYGVRVLVL